MRAGEQTGRRRAEAGFTLLEIVVALLVLGILLATLSRGTRFGLAAFDRQDRMIATGGRLEATDRTLRRLVVGLDPGTATDGGTVVGARHALALRSVLPVATGPDDTGATPADLRLTVSKEHALVLDWLVHRHVRRTGPVPEPHRERLLSGVERIDIDYWADGAWHPTWRETLPPALIRIRIVFGSGDKRHWPDIVAAPARDQPGD